MVVPVPTADARLAKIGRPVLPPQTVPAKIPTSQPITAQLRPGGVPIEQAAVVRY